MSIVLFFATLIGRFLAAFFIVKLWPNTVEPLIHMPAPTVFQVFFGIATLALLSNPKLSAEKRTEEELLTDALGHLIIPITEYIVIFLLVSIFI